MLVSSALVLMMTGPGPGAVLRRPGAPQERARHHDAQLHPDGAWSRCSGRSSATAWPSAKATPFIGDLQLRCSCDGVGAAPNADYAGTIPQQTFMVYQLMFAIITPALISGAFAERMKFSAMLLFMMLWTLIVYFPMAHMVWGKGGLLNAFSGRQDSRASISPAARWCTSPRAFRRWSARCIWASAMGYPQRADEAAQPGAQLHRRLPAVGRLVRIQRRQRAGRVAAWPPAPSSPRTSARRPRRSAGCSAEWMQHGKPSVLGAISGRGGRTGRHHAGLRLRQADARRC